MELKRRTPEEREAYLLDQVTELQSALAAATAECERLRGECDEGERRLETLRIAQRHTSEQWESRMARTEQAFKEATGILEERLAAKDAMLAAAERDKSVRDMLLDAAHFHRELIEFQFKQAGIRIFRTGAKWRMLVEHYGYPATFDTPIEAVNYALAAGWLEPTQQPTQGE